MTKRSDKAPQLSLFDSGNRPNSELPIFTANVRREVERPGDTGKRKRVSRAGAPKVPKRRSMERVRDQ